MYHSVANRLGRIVIATVLALRMSSGLSATPHEQRSGSYCKPAGPLILVPELHEGSGLAASRRTPGRFWSHNDSGEPVLVALDGAGRVSGRLQLTGATVEDWEAIAVGPCPSGSCIHVADIGDNGAERERITVYRIGEPAMPTGTAHADVFHATYPDGAHDAEALLITPDGRLHIVTKGDPGPVSVYRFPAELRAGARMPLERVGQSRDSGSHAEADGITDGAVSPDGRWVVLRTVGALIFYPASDILAGRWSEAERVDLTAIDEPQGEGVTFGTDDSVYLISEGGGNTQPGTFARLTCRLSRE
jgi:hypothetical protein